MMFSITRDGNRQGSLLSRLPYTYWGIPVIRIPTGNRLPFSPTEGFTDRGRQWHFKAIATRVKGTESSVVAGRNAEFILRDANGRELSTLQLMTNEFGSASGEFTLPTGIMTGGFTITTEGGHPLPGGGVQASHLRNHF